MSATTTPATRAASAPPSFLRTTVGSVLPLVIGIGLALAVKAYFDTAQLDYYAKVLIDIGINVVLAVSLNLVNGFTGQFSIGHAGFMAVGGYTAVALSYYGSYALWGDAGIHGGFLGPGEWLMVAGCIAGGLTAALVGYLVGLPSLRLRGDYLAIVTLGFGEIVRVVLQQTNSVLYDAEEIRNTSAPMLMTHLGGALGFTGIPKYTNLFWVYAAVTVTLLVSYRIKYSSTGRAFLSIREDEIAAESMGIPIAKYKVRAFVLAALFAGVAGGLFAHEVGTALNPRELAFQKSFDLVIMVVLGGMGSISGAALAAVLLTIVPEILRDPPQVWPAGLVAMALAFFLARQRTRTVLTIAVITVVLGVLRWVAVANDLVLSDYRMILYALMLVVMMIVRPQGLFGVHEIWEIFAPRRRARAGAKEVT